ncbi:hypothetical protein ElyMa_003790100 [Elysia marginata]|uniref:Uncharacterized protein n=1 Tax=Elysia marginata TaxID=1093978 RepID=A0AAV4FBF2_9GAST|nr:hypothetical protein ElyMa_003790100 [Elysia marginata]
MSTPVNYGHLPLDHLSLTSPAAVSSDGLIESSRPGEGVLAQSEDRGTGHTGVIVTSERLICFLYPVQTSSIVIARPITFEVEMQREQFQLDM